MKIAITALLSMLLLTGAALPALAQNTTTTKGTAPNNSNCVVKELTFGATYPGQVIEVAPSPVPSVALDYLPRNMDFNGDFTFEAFGGWPDQTPGFSGGGD